MTPGATADVTVVVPVRNGAGLLPALLDGLDAQTLAPAEVVVVDDGSTDGTRRLAAARGARIVPGGGGPYRSRNTGWHSGSGAVVAFVDVRSRPEPRWLERTLAVLDDPAVAMATSQTVVVGGPGLVERASVLQQVFDVTTYVDRPWYLPYFATCNLLVRRSALAAVGGFPEVRSGGDAELCWRVQLAGLGSIGVAREPLMRWQARSGLRDALEQTHRYGRSRVELARRFPGVSLPEPTPAPEMARYVGRAAVALALRTATRRQPDAAARNLLSVYRGSTWLGSRRARRGGPAPSVPTRPTSAQDQEPA